MPIYEYKCTQCANQFEKWQNINDKPIEVCPQCQGKVKRIIGENVGFILKGSGFYKNDYPSASKSDQNVGVVRKPCKNPKYCCQK